MTVAHEVVKIAELSFLSIKSDLATFVDVFFWSIRNVFDVVASYIC